MAAAAWTWMAWMARAWLLLACVASKIDEGPELVSKQLVRAQDVEKW